MPQFSEHKSCLLLNEQQYSIIGLIQLGRLQAMPVTIGIAIVKDLCDLE